MNMKNLTMWGIIALLVLGLFNLFQNPATITASKDLPFSTFIEELDKGNVISVDIKGNNIVGTFSNGSKFKTYSPNYPNLVEKLSSKGISFSAGPVEDKMPSLFSVLIILVSNAFINCCLDFFMRQMQGGKGGAMGFGKSKAKLLTEAQGKLLLRMLLV